MGTPGARRLIPLAHAGVFTRRTSLAVLVLPDRDDATEPLALHGTAIPIWELFAAGRSVREVGALLAERFPNTPAGEIEDAVDDLAARLLDAGALVQA